MEVSGKFHPPAALSPGKEHLNPWDKQINTHAQFEGTTFASFIPWIKQLLKKNSAP